jgi:hypothetical protein
MNQPFIRRSSSRKDDAFNSKRGHNSFESKGKTLDTRALFSLWDISLLKRKQISFSRGAIS